MKDSTGVLIAVASVIVAGYFLVTNQDLSKQLEHLKIEHEAFKEGVIYSR